MISRRPALLLVGAMGFVGVGCRDTGPRAVVVVTIDTLRADHLGCYGDPRAATPNLDRLAAEGALFTRAFTPVPLTLPAHTTIFTGRFPPAHGVRNNGTYVVSPNETTLALLFQKAGYATGAFVGAFPVAASFGLDRGFSTYDDAFDVPAGEDSGYVYYAQRRADSVNDVALPWIAAHKGGDLFLWVHYYDPHSEYQPPPPFDRLFAGRPYDGEIAYVDHALGSLLDALARSFTPERTLILVVGDHGESLGEHGEDTHGFFVYQPTLRVPLILWSPGRVPAAKSDLPVSSADIFPTILDLAGLRDPAPVSRAQGVSLAPLLAGTLAGASAPAAGRAGGGSLARPPGEASPLAGEPPSGTRRRLLYFESLLPRLDYGWSPLVGCTDGRFKYIRAPRPELYDLDLDPRELHNLASVDTPRMEEMKRACDELASSLAGREEPALTSPNPEALEKLRSLGYAAGGAEPAPSGPEAGVDPKDRIGVFDSVRKAVQAVAQGRREEGYALFERLVREDPHDVVARWRYAEALESGKKFEEVERLLAPVRGRGSAYYWVPAILARIAAARGETEKSLVLWREERDLDPNRVRGTLQLALALRGAGQASEALAELDSLLRDRPAEVPVLELAGSIAGSLGRADQSEAYYRRSLAAAPRSAESLGQMGLLLFKARRYAEAREWFQRLAEASPGSALAARYLGIDAFISGDLDAAVKNLSLARSREPDNLETLYYLALASIKAGRVDEAEPLAREILSRNSQESLGYRVLGLVRQAQGRPDEAAVAFRQALELNPSDTISASALEAITKNH